jgi:DNA mismatch repair protein MutS
MGENALTSFGMSSDLEQIKLTPMMEQWKECKEASKGALLLFRMGDFYEAFYEDAQIVAEELELTLTKRQGIPMSGVPWHTCDAYIDKLVGKGHRVAIAEQTEDPKKAKGLVKRAIVRIVTPGTLVNSSLLREKSHNFIVALSQIGAVFGLALCDITTTSFRVMEVENREELFNELYRLNPSEILLSKKFREKQAALLREFENIPFSIVEEWHFEHQRAYRYLTTHFRVPHLDGFGLKGCPAAINAAGALLAYIQEELSLPIHHIQEIKPYSTQDSLLLDRICQSNLELIEPLQEKRRFTLLFVIDHTLTPMGGRLLREWLKKPLLDVKEIEKRQDAVEALCKTADRCERLSGLLKEVRDLERLMMKISARFATPRDLSVLRHSLEKIAPIKEIVRNISCELLFHCSEKLIDLGELIDALKRALVDEPPLRISEGKIIRAGFHPPLDELRMIMTGGKEWLARYQMAVKEETGIKNLKVSFNKIFGYYIEVSKGQASLMPPSFDRKQTLVNAERFTSLPLKEYENKVLSAEEESFHIEEQLFQTLQGQAATYERRVFEMASALAQIDALLSLATAAKKYRYVRPLVDLSTTLQIVEGRHPVVEAAGGKGSFIPNDTLLDGIQERMMLITGPNMAGKSTYIRQVALIVILAQMGSFVPAKSARLGVIDRIFTRIGASDDLSRGQSTFMVEMSETANILNTLTPRSLIILDEVGRGTSTFDGMSIAWAVAEFLLATEAKTLFATHYCELTELEKTVPGSVNYHASVQEWNDEVIFLHKIAKGGADRSYGIHVARLAGLPLSVIQRANAILKKLETHKEQGRRPKKESTESQLLLF